MDGETKVCKKCGQRKCLLEFNKASKYLRKNDGVLVVYYNPSCKECVKFYKGEYWIKNRQALVLKMKERYIPHPKKIVLKDESYRIERKRRRKISHSKWYREKGEEYRLRWNAERGRECRRNRRLDPMFRLNETMSTSILRSLCRGGLSKRGRTWTDITGYTVDDLKKYLESLFTVGMSWENHSRFGWHIDHIIPKARLYFTSMDDPTFKFLWSLKNLRPIWWRENLSKGFKIESKRIQLTGPVL